MFAGLLTMFALASCLPLALSPEAVAVREANNSPMGRDFTTDPNSIRVLQKQTLGEFTYILVTFQGFDARIGKENCQFLHRVKKMALGWGSTSGGGGCSSGEPDVENIPLSISGNSGGGDLRGDAGYSAVSGEVYRDDIRFVHITWDDGMLQQADVINNSYLALRAGRFNMQKLEALDANIQVVFTNEPETAPGKQ